MAAEETELPAVLFKTLEMTCGMAACGHLADFQRAALCIYEGKLVMWVSRRRLQPTLTQGRALEDCDPPRDSSSTTSAPSSCATQPSSW